MAFTVDEAEIRRLFPEVDTIRDPALRRGVIDIWIETGAECGWENIQQIPKSLGVEKHRRLVDHVRGVTRMALALAEIAEREYGTAYQRDHLIAGCLLHDCSKTVETEPDPAASPTNAPAAPGRVSALGDKIQHAVYTSHKAFAHKLPLEVTHLILTHTHQSNVRSKTIEAAYLFYADSMDSDVGIITAGGRSLMERWELGK